MVIIVESREELARHLLDGKKLVRANGIHPDCYVYFDGHSNTPFKYKNGRGSIIPMSTLWEYKKWKVYEEPVKELTVEEIEAKLGYKVKVVGG